MDARYLRNSRCRVANAFDAKRLASWTVPEDLRGTVASIAAAKRTQRGFRSFFVATLKRFYARHAFFHPVPCCDDAKKARRPKQVVRGRGDAVEVYACTCADGTVDVKKFRRFRDPRDFFRYRYGRCGEFAAAFCFLAANLGFVTRFVLAYRNGFNHSWSEVLAPNGRWVPMDSTMARGYDGVCCPGMIDKCVALYAIGADGVAEKISRWDHHSLAP